MLPARHRPHQARKSKVNEQRHLNESVGEQMQTPLTGFSFAAEAAAVF